MVEGLMSYHLYVCVFLFYFAISAVMPFMTDVTMEALCPGKDECSLAIYITGLYQSIIGLGSVFAIPVMGNLSDVYGRKALLTIPFTFCIIPLMLPFLTDVTMEALCPGKDECSLAIYITGLYQSIIGLGSVFSIPVMGNLSDVYGRKALLTIPFTFCIIPLMILAYSRTKNFVYAYYVTKTLSTIVESSVQCLALAYVADNISEGRRGSLFGILIGAGSAGTLAGALAARFIPAANIFAIAAITSVITAVYLQLFLKDSTSPHVSLIQPIMKTTEDRDEVSCEPLKDMQVFNKVSSFRNGVRLIKNSKTFKLAALVAFFNMLAIGGLEASLFYYLKARFQFDKDQFADISIIFNIAATITHLFVVPWLAPILGDNILLSLGLSSVCIMMLIYSIAWSFWVPFVAALFCFVYFLTEPSLCSIVSKQVGKGDQGMAQGCISSIASLANIVAPLIYSPLTALFISEAAPFHYPGFSMLCIGLAWFIAFIASTLIPPACLESKDNAGTTDDLDA